MSGKKRILVPVATVKQHLQQHLQLLSDCIHDGFDEYFTLPNDQRIKLHARSQASDIRDFIVDAVKRRFDAVQGVQFVERRGMFLLVVDGVASIRFKKLDRKKRSRNVETQQSLMFSSGELPGFLESTACIDAGYILDRFGTSIASAHVVFPKVVQHGVPYSIELPPRSSRATVVPMTPEQLPVPQTTVTVRSASKVLQFEKKADGEQ